MGYVATASVTIASGETTSTPAEIDGARLIGIGVPSAFTGTSLTVELSYDGETYLPWSDAGAAVELSVAASSLLDCWPYPAARYVRVVSNSAEAADRTLSVAYGEF